MNILILDDLFLPDRAKVKTSPQAIFQSAAADNLKRQTLLAKEFQKLGANVLITRLVLCKSDLPLSYEYSEIDAVSFLSVKLPTRQSSMFFRTNELLKFALSLFENAPSLAGIFKPDIVFCTGVLPFTVLAGEKIATSSDSVLVTQLSALPAELVKGLKLYKSFAPVLKHLKLSTETAISKSTAVLAAFPRAQEKLFRAQNIYPTVLPSFFEEKPPSERALLYKEILSGFGDGDTFVLAFCGELEDGFSVEELILSAAKFKDKFALVFPFGGTKRNFFKRFVAKRGITNVFFPDPFPNDELETVLSSADGIFVSESTLSKGLIFENYRFWNALGAQKPVIAASEYNFEFFKKAKGVIITKPNRVDSITLGIEALLNTSESERQALGCSNRKFYENNSLQNFAKEVFRLFNNLVDQKEIEK